MHTSTLKMIESTFGLSSLTARDAHARDLRQVLLPKGTNGVPESAIPTSSQVPGPADGAAAICSAGSVQVGLAGADRLTAASAPSVQTTEIFTWRIPRTPSTLETWVGGG